MMEYAVFIPWLFVALAAGLVLMVAEILVKLIEHIKWEIKYSKALQAGKRFYVY